MYFFVAVVVSLSLSSVVAIFLGGLGGRGDGEDNAFLCCLIAAICGLLRSHRARQTQSKYSIYLQSFDFSV